MIARATAPWLVAITLSSLLAVAAEPDAEPARGQGTAAAAPAAALRVESVAVAGDRDVEVVLGPDESPDVIVYMHGVCGDPLAFRSWAEAASAVGTLISLRGDRSCDKQPGRSKWSWNAHLIDRRIRAAIGAVDALRQARARGEKPAILSTEDVIVLGYSQGARRAELLASHHPERYRRVGLLASPKQPEAAWLRKTQRVLLVAGERDIRQHLRDGRDELARRGKKVRYRELPEARHGEYGPRALEVMRPALQWLAHGPAVAPGGGS